MLQRYIKSKKTLKQGILNFWLSLRVNWVIIPAILFFVIIYLYTSSYERSTANYNEILIKVNDKLIDASSIISAIIISFLVSKVLQIRQEKLARWSEYNELTQKTHNFRNAVFIIFKSWNFWVQGLKSTIETTYKELEFYDVRKVGFVHSTKLSILAKNFIHDDTFGDTKNLYLELKSFFPMESLFDPTIHAKFEVPQLYDLKLIELWTEFNCGNGLYYFFNYKYGFFQDDFLFQNVHSSDKLEAEQYALKIDKERYENIEFGAQLYDLLGGQFTEEILPKLYLLTRYFNSSLPISVIYLTFTLSLILGFGIIIPFLNSLYAFNSTYTIIAISMVLSVIFYFIISFYWILKKQVKVGG